MDPTPPPSSRALLFVDLALLGGLVPARQAATALLAAWEGRLPGVRNPREALIKMAALAPEVVARLDAEVDRQLGVVGDGEPGAPGDGRGGPARPPLATTSDAPMLIRPPGEEEGAVRIALRPPPADRYRDFVPIGHGGMGVVYAAYDVAMNRTVAFKVLRPTNAQAGDAVTPPAPIGLAPPPPESAERERYEAYQTRFLQEAWVGGGMEHPGIVPVHEVGCTEAGVPYYTMRLVRGHRTLATALDEARDADLDARLPLLEPFLRACDAVRYAHSRGVLHRDLKPGNIALGEFGETFVVDWGLARLTGDRPGPADAWQEGIELLRRGTGLETGHGVVGTIGYAAPEALGGDLGAADASSDVYSLGVILFEILTGRLPFDPREDGRFQAQVGGAVAPRASALEPAVPAALDRLAADALAADPTRRPGEVAVLVEGIRTWQADVARDRQIRRWMEEAELALVTAGDLDGDPLFRQLERATTACRRVLERVPDHAEARALLERGRDLGERALARQAVVWRRRQLRRLGVAALCMLVVLGVVVAALLEGRRREADAARETATAARAAEATHRARAERTMGFMLEDLREELESMGRLDLLAELGVHARAHYEPVPVEEESLESFRRRVRALRALGDVYLAVGRLPAARTLFDEARTLALRFTARPDGGPYGTLEQRWAEVRLADVDRLQGFANRALERLADLRPALDAMAGSSDAPPDLRAVRLAADQAEGRAALVVGDYDRAHAALRRALEDDAVSDAAAEGVVARRRLELELDLARMESHRGRDDAARVRVEGVVAAARRRLAATPEDVRARALLAAALSTASRIAEAAGDEPGALTATDEALARYGALSRARPENLRWRADLASLHVRRGDLRYGVEAREDAAREFETAHAIAEDLVARDPTNASWLNLVITTCDRRALTTPDGPVAVRGFRETAAAYARTLYALDATNPRWKLILAYTLLAVPGGGGPEGRTHRAALLEEGYDLARQALVEIPGPEDVAAIVVHLARELARLRVSRDEHDGARHVLTEAFDALLELSRSHPDAPGPWLGLAMASATFPDPLAACGPDGEQEASRQARAYLHRLEEALAAGGLSEARTRALAADRETAAQRLVEPGGVEPTR